MLHVRLFNSFTWKTVVKILLFLLKTKMPVYLPFVVVDLHHKQIHIFRSLPWLSLWPMLLMLPAQYLQKILWKNARIKTMYSFFKAKLSTLMVKYGQDSKQSQATTACKVCHIIRSLWSHSLAWLYVSDCCLIPIQQFFSYIMARTS